MPKPTDPTATADSIVQMPTIGRILAYVLTAADAAAINARRSRASGYVGSHLEHAMGGMVHQGKDVAEGDKLAMIVTVAGDSGPISGQVFLDGNDTHWVQDVNIGTDPGTWSWPARA